VFTARADHCRGLFCHHRLVELCLSLLPMYHVRSNMQKSVLEFVVRELKAGS
jgi:hypothetical protein